MKFPLTSCHTMFCHVVGLICFGLSFSGLCTPLFAQQPVTPPAAATAQATSELEQDPALGVKVTFKSSAQSLESLLATLQNTSGITLTATNDTQAAHLLVTARVRELPLATVLGSFSRLYGVRWVKVGEKAYEMRNSEMDTLHRKLLAVGSHSGTVTVSSLQPIKH